MRLSSLRLRLLLAACVFSLAATLLAALGLSLLFKRHVTAWVDTELGAQMDVLIAGIDKGPEGALAVTRPPGDVRFTQPLSGRYWEVLIEQTGAIFRSRSLWDFEIALPQEATVDDLVRSGTLSRAMATLLGQAVQVAEHPISYFLWRPVFFRKIVQRCLEQKVVLSISLLLTFLPKVSDHQVSHYII